MNISLLALAIVVVAAVALNAWLASRGNETW